MVLQKRLYYGFDGSQAPPIPRGARSIRKRGLLRKNSLDSEICAFDLLASVADKILLEEQSHTTASSNGICHKGSAPDIIKEEQQPVDYKLVDFPSQSSMEIGLDVIKITNKEGGFSSGPASEITNPDCTEKTGVDVKNPLISHGKEKFQSHIGEPSFGFRSDTFSSEDPEFFDRSLSKPDKYTYNTDAKVHGDHYACGFPSLCRHNVNLVSKDDDDNSYECSKRSNVLKTIGDRRIKKLVAPRSSRAPATKMNIPNLTDFGDERSTTYQSRRRVSYCQRSQRIYPFKKRKLLHTTSNDAHRCSYEEFYEPLEKENGEFSEAAGQSALVIPRESNMKLRIKSFEVPELFIELPETATIGSLKKTVMDAIKTLLGNALHIGVLVKGRKIKDDNSTLLQSGISHDTLGFTLEPSSSQIQKPVFFEQPLSRSLEVRGAGDFKALVEVPESNEQALTLFPQTPLPLEKSRKSEIAQQRRMRRPFSVSEVEALVQAVEELGTGRWRDVKMRAFDNTSHRTYVDLKDKWKTLVHTARISPQQRRGEPVPQELLDRVLAAQSYWSHRQAKHQSDTCILI